ncbi:MAG: hypothetical protein J6T08_08965 [Lentisphaeria bacterium]|nr:hypothetical protein [Lentisphaeria bacterium]
MTKGTGSVVKGDEVTCTLSNGTTSIEFDIAAESGPYLGHGAHSTGKFTSQQYKKNTITKDGGLEATTLTVTFDAGEYVTLTEWWNSGESLTYTVSGAEAGLVDITYTECFVRVTDGPKATPGLEGNVTISIEISTIMNAKDVDPTAGA